jgi:hypothetical protein
MTGLAERMGGEFTGAERNVAGVVSGIFVSGIFVSGIFVSGIFVSGIFLSTIVIPVRALRTGHDRAPAGTLCPAG